VVSQGSNALTALARIPILVIALGASGYGTFTLVQAVVAWLVVVPLGLRQSLRAMGAQAMHSSPAEAAVVWRAHWLHGRRMMLLSGAAGVVVCIALALVWPQLASPSADRMEAVGVLVCTAVVCASGFLGAVHAGWLEASDRLALVNMMGAATGIVGLAIALLLWKLDAPFFLFAIAGVAASVAPSWCALIWHRPERTATQASAALVEAVRSNSRRFLYGVVATLLATGLTPFVIGLLLGPTEAASYFVAARLAFMVTLVPTALTPVLWNRHARIRSLQGTGGSHRGLRWLLLVSLGTGLPLAVAFVFVGPRLGHLLGTKEVPAPLGLYVAFALLGVLQFVQAPLTAALSGPRGTRFMSRTTTVAAVVSVLGSLPGTVLLGVSGPVWAFVLSFGAMTLVWVHRVRMEGGYVTDRHVDPLDVVPPASTVG
jgi:O-antigen/teichoic acid export membrane protein